MYTSLFSQEVQSVFDTATKSSGQSNGPFPSPSDWRDEVIYFLMVDRFNNPAKDPIHKPYDDPNYFAYQGGNFAGVQKSVWADG